MQLRSRAGRSFGGGILTGVFGRDIIMLLIVSIVIGSMLAVSISYAADAYFSKTLASFVGEYGQYDLVIQVREEKRADAVRQIEKIISDSLPGAQLKEGPTLTGKSNFFIALPLQYKTKQLYENVGNLFGSVPGGATVGVMSEPRLTVRGVPDGAKQMLIERISAVDGVLFAFRDGASVGIIIAALDKTPLIQEQLKQILNEYQVLEIGFPAGAEPDNPIQLGEKIANQIELHYAGSYAKNVSIDGQNDDMTSMISTMMEMKRFLKAYASQLVIVPSTGNQLLQGDVIVLPGRDSAAITAGARAPEGSIVAVVGSLNDDGTAEASIMQGDASLLAGYQAYAYANDAVGKAIGLVSVKNPRQQLGQALTEMAGVAEQLPGFIRDSTEISRIAASALDNYANSLDAIEASIGTMQAAGDSIQTAAGNLANINTNALQKQLDTSSRALGNVLQTLQVIQLLNADAAGAIDNVTATQKSMDYFQASLQALDHVAADARSAKQTVDRIAVSSNQTLATLRTFDVVQARRNLHNANTHLSELQRLDAQLIAMQLQYLAAAAPNVSDQEIYGSVKMLDRFIDGQIIPSQRIQILTNNMMRTEELAPLVYQQAGHNNALLYKSSLGVIEPNVRNEVYSLLNEVRAVLAAMAAVVITILLLVLDHTAVMSVIKRRRLDARVKQKAVGWRGVTLRIAVTFTAAERQYGMVVGAVLLTAIFALSGAAIPYVPWLGIVAGGALLGLIVAGNTEKISPVSAEEMMAGEAIGLSFDEIMREIVIPSSRPGLLQKLNYRKLRFK